MCITVLIVQLCLLTVPRCQIFQQPERGTECGNVVCHLRGEKHYVLRHVFSKHLTFDEWPYSCPVCQYCHYDYTIFRKHPQWYSLHTALKGTSAVPLPSSAEVREESKVVYSMTRQLSIEDSADHWKRRQRAPATVRPSTKLAASIDSAHPHFFQWTFSGCAMCCSNGGSCNTCAC